MGGVFSDSGDSFETVFGHFLTGGNGTGGTRMCVVRACAHARHTNDTHAFPQATFFAVSKSRPIASLTRHLLVTEKKRTPQFGSSPHLKVTDF